MNPERRLMRLCRRHRIPYEEAGELLPLLERAARSPPEIRRCLVAVVEAAVASRAAEREDHRHRKRQLEESVLAVLASLLHRWEPPSGEAPEGEAPEGG